MKQALVRWLLRLLGSPRPILPELTVYVLVAPGERLAEATTNLFRARATALQCAKNKKPVRILRCVPVAEEPYQ